MNTLSDAAKFLQAVFPDHAEHCIFANCPDLEEKPKSRWFHYRDVSKLKPDINCYFTLGAYPNDGSVQRTAIRVVEMRVFALDDVHEKIPLKTAEKLGVPTGKTRTSRDSAQWVYRLSRPVSPAEWPVLVEAIKTKIGVPSLECVDLSHVVRLPMGINNKNEDGRRGWKVALEELNPEAELDVDELLLFWGSAGPGPSASSGSGGGTVRDIEGLGVLVPNNDDHYDLWEANGERFKALGIDKEKAFKAFDEYSSRSSKYDAEETVTRWKTFKANRTSGKELLTIAATADPKGFATWQAAEGAGAFDDGAVAPEMPQGRGRVKFRLGEKKQILALKENAERGLTGLGITCSYDAFHHRYYVWQSCLPEELTDELVLRMRGRLNAAYGKDFGPVHIGDALMALGLENAFNPVCDMLAAAERDWDGTKRLDRLGPDYFHSDDTELARAYFRKAMLAAVRRARRPGCKFDQILVVESPEGWDKSTAWELLAGRENFSDANILGKDARAVQEELGDVWIHEIADLSGLARAEVEAVKAFASRTNDRARAAYGRFLRNQLRQSIEVGTTNADSYLLSATGNRRFWTVKLNAPVDTARLGRDRLQLWGEAAAMESAGETLVLPRHLWAVAAVEQEKRRVVDPWEDELANLKGYLGVSIRNGKPFITRVGVHEFLRQRGQVLNANAGKRIAEIMRKLGWEDIRVSVDNVATRGFTRDHDTFSIGGVTNVSPEDPF